MGTVYKAHDRGLEEAVAIKVLRHELAGDADIAWRFPAEVRLARKVNHRNVCRMHEYGQDGLLRYISMEFVSGTDLKKVVQALGGLTPTRRSVWRWRSRPACKPSTRSGSSIGT